MGGREASTPRRGLRATFSRLRLEQRPEGACAGAWRLLARLACGAAHPVVERLNFEVRRRRRAFRRPGVGNAEVVPVFALLVLLVMMFVLLVPRGEKTKGRALQSHSVGAAGSARVGEKPFFMTNEFLTLVGLLGAIAMGVPDNFDAPRGWPMITIVAAAYLVSRAGEVGNARSRRERARARAQLLEVREGARWPEQ
jgi:hypothetical protein